MSVRVTVIGGGPSGLMAAIQAARQGAEVLLLEQNRKPGRKLLLTGNGRCNLTNTEILPDSYRGSHPEFSEQAEELFSPRDAISFFLSIGIYTVSHDGWVYPYSEQSMPVLSHLLAEAERLQVKIKNSEKVTEILQEQDAFRVRTEGWDYPCERVILCSGSSASSAEGSDGSGYELAGKLGHRILEPLPALTYLTCRMKKERKWNGVRVTAELTLLADQKKLCSRRGQLQLTDTGVSGIPAFQVSRYAARALAEGKKVTAVINFMPDYDVRSFEKFLDILKKASASGEPEVRLDGLFQEGLSEVFSGEAKDPEALAKEVCSYELEVTGTGPLERSQTASGGIDTSEVNPQTMESKLVPGLYFAGEILDVDGDCGGYNLQWAWTSGYLAGRAAAGNPAASEEYASAEEKK
ncbi:MAG: aminoacetone oxidase family FAD-binding enzyme [Lachnospiraceae bacterium]|jgi:predicted Rossmann fold flavoprotein|nr:aminoacetone oxidase family FAD-binding enzyme [Lachnospiraceae bacterium]